MLPRPAGRSCPAGWGECPSRRGSRCSSRRSSRCGFRSWGRCDFLPHEADDVGAAVGLEANAFLFEQFPLLRPAGGGAPGAVDHAMAGEFCRGGGHGTAYAAGVVGHADQPGDLLVGNDLPGGDLRHDGIYLVVECPACQFVGLQWFSVDSGLRRVPRPSPLAMEGRGCPGAAGPDGGSTHAGMGAPMGTVFTTRFPSGARRSPLRSGGRSRPECHRP